MAGRKSKETRRAVPKKSGRRLNELLSQPSKKEALEKRERNPVTIYLHTDRFKQLKEHSTLIGKSPPQLIDAMIEDLLDTLAQ